VVTDAPSNPSSNPVTSEYNARSFDRPRERAAPEALSGHWSNGDEATVALTRITLIVAIKSNCDGCRAFINEDLSDLPVPVLVIGADEDESSEWLDATQPVLVSPDAFRLLDIRWPPFYVLIDPIARRVVSEGVLFGLAQVAAEIAPFLDV
jgi:hypothetical protein